MSLVAMSPSPPATSRTSHLLVVDDEPSIRDLLAAALRRQGYDVTTRNSGREALEALARAPFDLLVTDLKMPEMNGLDLIRAAKQVAPRIGSVLITAFASVETALSALRGGADDYLLKPFGLDDLRRVVERVLGERHVEVRDQEALSRVREENDSLRRERRDTEEALLVARRDLKLSRRHLERRLGDLEFVADLSDLLAGEDLDQILRTTARITARRFHAFVTRIETDLGWGLLAAEHREGTEPVALPLPLGALLVDRARREASGVVRDEVLGQGRPLEALAAGLSVGGKAAGGIVLLRPLLPREPREEDLALLGMLVRSLKPALEAERHRRRSEANALEVARGLLEALEGRGIARSGHAQRVVDLVLRAADRLGLPSRERHTLATAAHLHDIGEVGVPEELLVRAGPLNPDEMEVVRAHAVLGARLIEPLGDPARLVRHHHERPDGRGYPDGLAEDDIPLGSGLIGVAEAYDAMTHARPYHTGLSGTEARREILRLRGVQFLPRAVDAILEVLPA